MVYGIKRKREQMKESGKDPSPAKKCCQLLVTWILTHACGLRAVIVKVPDVEAGQPHKRTYLLYHKRYHQLASPLALTVMVSVRLEGIVAPLCTRITIRMPDVVTKKSSG